MYSSYSKNHETFLFIFKDDEVLPPCPSHHLFISLLIGIKTRLNAGAWKMAINTKKYGFRPRMPSLLGQKTSIKMSLTQLSVVSRRQQADIHKVINWAEENPLGSSICLAIMIWTCLSIEDSLYTTISTISTFLSSLRFAAESSLTISRTYGGLWRKMCNKAEMIERLL